MTNALKPIGYGKKILSVEEALKDLEGYQPPVVPATGEDTSNNRIATEKKSIHSSGDIILGRFDVASVEYVVKEKCHVFRNVLTPVGLFPWVRLYDQLLPQQNLDDVRVYNTQAVEDGLPIRIPAFLDYALSAESYRKQDDPKCRDGIAHCLEKIWIPDANGSTFLGSSTSVLYQAGQQAVVEQGVGLPTTHNLYHKKAYDIAGDNGEITAQSTDLQSCIEGLLFENNLSQAAKSLTWRMQPKSRKAYQWRLSKQSDSKRVVVFDVEGDYAGILVLISGGNLRPARGINADAKNFHKK